MTRRIASLLMVLIGGLLVGWSLGKCVHVKYVPAQQKEINRTDRGDT